jgi:hypothetical protein
VVVKLEKKKQINKILQKKQDRSRRTKGEETIKDAADEGQLGLSHMGGASEV